MDEEENRYTGFRVSLKYEELIKRCKKITCKKFKSSL
jgi:hypothetical protein